MKKKPKSSQETKIMHLYCCYFVLNTNLALSNHNHGNQRHGGRSNLGHHTCDSYSWRANNMRFQSPSNLLALMMLLSKILLKMTMMEKKYDEYKIPATAAANRTMHTTSVMNPRPHKAEAAVMSNAPNPKTSFNDKRHKSTNLRTDIKSMHVILLQHEQQIEDWDTVIFWYQQHVKDQQQRYKNKRYGSSKYQKSPQTSKVHQISSFQKWNNQRWFKISFWMDWRAMITFSYKSPWIFEGSPFDKYFQAYIPLETGISVLCNYWYNSSNYSPRLDL